MCAAYNRDFWKNKQQDSFEILEIIVDRINEETDLVIAPGAEEPVDPRELVLFHRERLIN